MFLNNFVLLSKDIIKLISRVLLNYEEFCNWQQTMTNIDQTKISLDYTWNTITIEVN